MRDQDLAKLYAPPGATLPAGSPLARLGLVTGLLFASPFLFAVGLGIAKFREKLADRDGLVFIAAFVGVAAAMCLCGWWWATRARPGARRLFLQGVMVGIGLTAVVFGFFVTCFSRWRAEEALADFVNYFSVVTPILTVWLLLLGALVRWRVRVLERRASDVTAARANPDDMTRASAA